MQEQILRTALEREMNMIRYKLTDASGYTRRGKLGQTLWDNGTVRETNGVGELCGPGWTHVYTHPLLAVMLDPIHGQYGDSALMIVVKVSGRCKTDYSLKEGWTVVQFHKKIKRPKVNLVQKIALGILCGKEVCKDKYWHQWADDWLSGKDRSKKAAWAAADAARAAARAARAADAARDAEAAYAAIFAADAAYDTRAARAAEAAYAAIYAADAKTAPLNLIAIAKKAMMVK